MTGYWPAELYIAGPDGRLQSQVGRVGEGPGEFIYPSFVVETATGYQIIDQRLARVTILGRTTLDHVASHSVPFLSQATLRATYPVAFQNGSFVVHARTAPGPASPRLHLLSREGDLIRSFGDSASLGNVAPVMALSGDTAFWVAERDRYRLTKLDRTGSVLQVIERDVDWLSWPPAPREEGVPHARIQGVYEDSYGHLWVFAGIRTPALYSRMAEEGGRMNDVQSLGTSTDPEDSGTLVEVLDSDTGELLGYLRTAGSRSFLIAGGPFTFSRRESESGQPLLDIWVYSIEQDVLHDTVEPSLPGQH